MFKGAYDGDPGLAWPLGVAEPRRGRRWGGIAFRVSLALAALCASWALAHADVQGDPRPISWSRCSGTVAAGGTAQNAPSGAQANPLRGYFLQNPDTATAQGIGAAENLYYDPSGTASTAAGVSPFLAPGQSITVGPGTTFAQPISVNAVTSAHKFICMVGQ